MPRKRTEKASNAAVKSILPSICAAMREARLAAGLSQPKLASALGVTQTQVSRWETTREPSLDVIAATEEILGVAKGQLLRDAGYVHERNGMTTEQLIARDPRLTRTARDVVLAAYRSVARPE